MAIKLYQLFLFTLDDQHLDAVQESGGFLYVRLRLLVVESRSAIRETELGKMTGFAPQTHGAAGHGQGCGVAPPSQQHVERSVGPTPLDTCMLLKHT